jgi:hypothetical protein
MSSKKDCELKHLRCSSSRRRQKIVVWFRLSKTMNRPHVLLTVVLSSPKVAANSRTSVADFLKQETMDVVGATVLGIAQFGRKCTFAVHASKRLRVVDVPDVSTSIITPGELSRAMGTIPRNYFTASYISVSRIYVPIQISCCSGGMVTVRTWESTRWMLLMRFKMPSTVCEYISLPRSVRRNLPVAGPGKVIPTGKTSNPVLCSRYRSTRSHATSIRVRIMCGISFLELIKSVRCIGCKALHWKRISVGATGSERVSSFLRLVIWHVTVSLRLQRISKVERKLNVGRMIQVGLLVVGEIPRVD